MERVVLRQEGRNTGRKKASMGPYNSHHRSEAVPSINHHLPLYSESLAARPAASVPCTPVMPLRPAPPAGLRSGYCTHRYIIPAPTQGAVESILPRGPMSQSISTRSD